MNKLITMLGLGVMGLYLSAQEVNAQNTKYFKESDSGWTYNISGLINELADSIGTDTLKLWSEEVDGIASKIYDIYTSKKENISKLIERKGSYSITIPHESIISKIDIYENPELGVDKWMSLVMVSKKGSESKIFWEFDVNRDCKPDYSAIVTIKGNDISVQGINSSLPNSEFEKVANAVSRVENYKL